MGTVFARLKVPAPDGSGALDDHGVHAFIVPLRDEDNQCFPGVEIKDCGYKVCHLLQAPLEAYPMLSKLVAGGACSAKANMSYATCRMAKIATGY